MDVLGAAAPDIHEHTGALVPPDPEDSQWARIEELLRSKYGEGEGTPVLSHETAPELSIQSDPGLINLVRIS